MRTQKPETISFQTAIVVIILFLFTRDRIVDRFTNQHPLMFLSFSQGTDADTFRSAQDATQAPIGNWENVPGPAPYPLFSADFVTEDNGWAVGMDGEILKWDGKTWSLFPSPVRGRGSLLAVKLLSATDGWIVGSSGTLLHWDGLDWKIEASPTTNYDLYAIAFLDPKHGWAVGGRVVESEPGTLNFDSIILKWGGISWKKISSPARYPLKSISMLNEQDGWAVGQGNTILHWDGQSWREYGVSKPDPNFSLYFYSIGMSNPNDGWIVGETLSHTVGEPLQRGGIILHWDGKNWSEFQHTKLGLRSLSLVSQNFGWAVGGDYNSTHGGSVILKWNGETWTEVSSPTKLPLEFIWATYPVNGWILAGGDTDMFTGSENAIFRYVAESTPTPTSSATASAIPTNAPTATATHIPATPTSPVPIATPTNAPLTKVNNLPQSIVAWLFATGLLIVIAGGAVFIFRRGKA